MKNKKCPDCLCHYTTETHECPAWLKQLVSWHKNKIKNKPNEKQITLSNPSSTTIKKCWF
jgi:hypothetical protein